MRNYIATFVLLLSSIACFAQNDDLYFTWIYDSISQKPIEGAEVSICYLLNFANPISSKKTSQTGLAHFKGVFEPGEEYEVVIKAEGYLQTFVPLHKTSTSTAGHSYNEFYLHREGGN